MPAPKKQTAPVYPKALLDKKITGVVVVGFIIDEKGNVADAWAVESPDPDFLAAVEAEARQKIQEQIKEAQQLRQRLEAEAVTRADELVRRAREKIGRAHV